MIKSAAIFGASSRIGVCVIKAAVEKGLNVRVLLEASSELPEEYRSSVEVVQGDVLNIQDVKATLENQDAAVVLLATYLDPGPGSVMSEGLKNIVAAMESLYIKVMSFCLSPRALHESRQISADTVEEHRRMFRLLECSDLHWIAVSPPSVTDDPPTTYTIIRDHLIGYNSISKHDLAKFLVDCLFMPERYQKTVEIASIPKR